MRHLDDPDGGKGQWRLISAGQAGGAVLIPQG